MEIRGIKKSVEEWKKDKSKRIYGERYHGDVWSQIGYEKIEDDNIIDITKILKEIKKEVNQENIERIMKGLIIERGEALYENKGGGKNVRGKRYKEELRKNREACIDIEKRNSGYLKDVPIIGRGMEEFDRVAFEKLCYLQCSKMEIMFWFRCINEKEFDRAVQSEYEMTFKEAFNMYRQGGFIGLRRSQFKMAEYVPSMNKFLSINYLGMSDSGKKEQETDSKVDKLIEAIKSVE